ncbi:MAG TPA: 3-isopropylmalate dehydratase small subunit [Sediminispirochaeta sp.]|nr:3-isopropylmalate dehydratase small subunit [Sediminispirochaeta sp.]
MLREGRVFKFGDHVNTDEIIPARFLATSDPVELAKYCMEDSRPGFGQREDLEGSILVAGENFGCGSSREHAPISIKAAGIGCVVAKSFARIFLRNAINIGLPIVELARTDEIEEDEFLKIDFDSGELVNTTKERKYLINVYPDFLQQIIRHGGWLPFATANLTPARVLGQRSGHEA